MDNVLLRKVGIQLIGLRVALERSHDAEQTVTGLRRRLGLLQELLRSRLELRPTRHGVLPD